MATTSTVHLLISICISFLLITSWLPSANSTKQEIILFEKPQGSANVNYSSPKIKFTESTPNVTFTLLSSTNSGVKFNSTTGACTNGTWMVYSEPDYTTNGSFHLLNGLTSDTKPQCINMSTTPIQSIRHTGHSDLSVSAISLYDNSSMVAGRELYFEGYRLVLPSMMTFWSYGYTGGLPFRVNPENITEASSQTTTCLELPKHNETQFNATEGNILTYKEKTELNVTEIRLGCGGKENQNVTPDYDITPFLPPTIHEVNGTKSHVNVTNKMPKVNTMNMTSPGIQLTLRTKSGPNTTESGQLHFIGTKLRLMEPMLLLNYTFTGQPAQNWTIYTDTYGTKMGKCLVHGMRGGLNGSAAADVEDIYVGAIELGCAKGAVSGAGSITTSLASYQYTVGTFLMLLFATVILK